MRKNAIEGCKDGREDREDASSGEENGVPWSCFDCSTVFDDAQCAVHDELDLRKAKVSRDREGGNGTVPLCFPPFSLRQGERVCDVPPRRRL